MEVKIERYSPQYSSKLREFLQRYQFNPYRNYRGIHNKKVTEYFTDSTIERIASETSEVYISRIKDSIIGVMYVTLLDWDTNHFGIKMAKLVSLTGNAMMDRNFRSTEELLSAVIAFCKERKIAHLTCRVDTEDLATVRTLEKYDFCIMDTLITFLFLSFDSCPIRQLRQLYKVKEGRESDLPMLMEIAQKAFVKDRFHLDPLIPSHKADTLYSEWIRSFQIDNRDKKVLVAYDSHGRPRGFLAYQLNSKLQKYAGVKVIGRGLSAVQSRAKGAYVALVIETIKESMESYDFAEFDTQLTNYEVIRIFNKFGFRLVRSQYTFHKWL